MLTAFLLLIVWILGSMVYALWRALSAHGNKPYTTLEKICTAPLVPVIWILKRLP